MTQRRRIESFDEFARLGAAWDELACASDLAEIFTSHAWFESWIRAYRAEGDLAIETLWRDGQLVGAAPLRRGQVEMRGLRAESLEFLWSAIAPRCNFLVAETADLAPLLEGVFSDDLFDVLTVSNLPAGSTTTEAFVAFLADRGIPHQDEPGFVSPYLRIEGTWDEHWASLGRERRRYLQKKCINRIEREGGFAIERIETESALESFIPEMYEISSKSWKADVDAALAPDEAPARLLVDFARRGLAKGWVDLWTLRLHGELVAFEYMICGHGRRAVVRSDYDLGFKYFTPGNSLRLKIIRSLFENGECAEYDLGGNDDPYKREWCDATRPHRTVTAASRRWRGRTILFAKNVVLPGLRRLRGARPGAEQ